MLRNLLFDGEIAEKLEFITSFFEIVNLGFLEDHPTGFFCCNFWSFSTIDCNWCFLMKISPLNILSLAIWKGNEEFKNNHPRKVENYRNNFNQLPPQILFIAFQVTNFRQFFQNIRFFWVIFLQVLGREMKVPRDHIKGGMTVPSTSPLNSTFAQFGRGASKNLPSFPPVRPKKPR